MDKSVLNSIKKALGIDEDEKYFDGEILMHINSMFFILFQLGVGPSEPFVIQDESATWSDFGRRDFEAVKSYIYLKVRLLFDPPQSSSVKTAIDEQTKELEWRLTIAKGIE